MTNNNPIILKAVYSPKFFFNNHPILPVINQVLQTILTIYTDQISSVARRILYKGLNHIMLRHTQLNFIQPGKPTQKAFVESLNSKFRNERLNQHRFRSLAEVRYEIDKWREYYNHVRPHSVLIYLSPIEYAK